MNIVKNGFSIMRGRGLLYGSGDWQKSATWVLKRKEHFQQLYTLNILKMYFGNQDQLFHANHFLWSKIKSDILKEVHKEKEIAAAERFQGLINCI